jgi:hypothetical protein
MQLPRANANSAEAFAARANPANFGAAGAAVNNNLMDSSAVASLIASVGSSIRACAHPDRGAGGGASISSIQQLLGLYGGHHTGQFQPQFQPPAHMQPTPQQFVNPALAIPRGVGLFKAGGGGGGGGGGAGGGQQEKEALPAGSGRGVKRPAPSAGPLTGGELSAIEALFEFQKAGVDTAESYDACPPRNKAKVGTDALVLN